jgi:hypothetical protein
VDFKREVYRRALKELAPHLQLRDACLGSRNVFNGQSRG